MNQVLCYNFFNLPENLIRISSFSNKQKSHKFSLSIFFFKKPLIYKEFKINITLIQVLFL